MKNVCFAKFRKPYKITCQLMKYALQNVKQEFIPRFYIKVLKFERHSFFVMFPKLVSLKISRYLSG